MKPKDGFLTEIINTDNLHGPRGYRLEMVSGRIGAHMTPGFPSMRANPVRWDTRKRGLFLKFSWLLGTFHHDNSGQSSLPLAGNL